MANLALDLTGTSVANLITDERHDVSTRNQRIFVLNKGAFFGKGLVIRNASTNRIMEPHTAYRILHMVREAVLDSNKEVYAVILILDNSVLDVLVTYQAIGGVYSNIASTINDKLGTVLDGSMPIDTIGQIIDQPIQVPPEHHLQNIRDFKSMGGLVTVVEGIRKAIMLGDTNAHASIYDFIDTKFNDVKNDIDIMSDYFTSLINDAESRFTRRNGSVIITDEDANPGTYMPGTWDRLPNVFLYGTNADGQIGQRLDVAAGTGHIARMTNFFARNDSSDGILRVISADKSIMGEGESVTFTLQTSGLPSGSTLPFRLEGITEDDLANGLLTGTFTINAAGIATTTVNIAADQVNDGFKTLKCVLTNFPNVYASVGINDTSGDMGIIINAYSEVIGEHISSVAERQQFVITVDTVGVTYGQTLYLLYSGTAVAGTDVTGQMTPNTQLPGNFVNGSWTLSQQVPTNVTLNGTGVVVRGYVQENNVTNDNKSFTISVSTTPNTDGILASKTLTITDATVAQGLETAFKLSSDSTTVTTVQEGTDVYLLIKAMGIYSNVNATVVWSGMQAADFASPLPSTVQLTTASNPSGVVTGMVPISILTDSLVENTETLVANITVPKSGGNLTGSTALQVTDSTVVVSGTLRFSSSSTGGNTITSANEGTTVYGIVETTNIPNGGVVRVTGNNRANIDTDFGSTPKDIIITNGVGIFSFVVYDDNVTEGIQSINFTLTSGTTTLGNKSLTINDTSTSSNGFITFASNSSGSNVITEVNEDESNVWVIFTTVGVPNNTVTGVSFTGIDSSDIIGSFPSTVTVVNNKASVQFKVTADRITEGDETLTVRMLLPNGSIIQNSLIIKDTSATPNIKSLYYSRTLNGNDPVTNTNENTTVYAYIETENVPNGTALTLTWTGTANNADFSAARPATVTVTNNVATIPLNIIADYVSEGNETVILKVAIPETTVNKSATLNIIDTSKPQALTLNFNTMADGSGSNVTSINEGQTVYAVISVTNAVDGDTVALSWSGNVEDIGSAKPTSVTVIGGKAAITVSAIADSIREDSPESIILTATSLSGSTANKTLTINDTSIGYATATWRTGAATSSGEILSTGINEGNTIYLHVNTFGIPANETLSLSYAGTNVNAADFTDTPPTTMITSASKGFAAFAIANDFTTEGQETINVTVKDSKGNTLIVSSVKILDSSLTPTFNGFFANDAAGNSVINTSVDEPTTGTKDIYAVVKTTNMPNGTIVQFEFTGTTDNADYSGTPVENIVNVSVNNNIGYYQLKILADNRVG